MKVAVFAFDSLSLTAQNKGETMVEIALTDINDNAPQITNLPSEVTITENRVNANLFKLNVSVNLSLLTNIIQERIYLLYQNLHHKMIAMELLLSLIHI